MTCGMRSFSKYWERPSYMLHTCSIDKSCYLVGGAGSARDEWLTRVAVVGRAAPLLALPLLSNLIVHRQQQMAHSMTAGAVRHHATSLYHCADYLSLPLHCLQRHHLMYAECSPTPVVMATLPPPLPPPSAGYHSCQDDYFSVKQQI